jgi:hypothetical protein
MSANQDEILQDEHESVMIRHKRQFRLRVRSLNQNPREDLFSDLPDVKFSNSSERQSRTAKYRLSSPYFVALPVENTCQLSSRLSSSIDSVTSQKSVQSNIEQSTALWYQLHETLLTSSN